MLAEATVSLDPFLVTLGGVITALISTAGAILLKRQRSPAVMMKEFLNLVNTDNERLRNRNQELEEIGGKLRDEMQQIREECRDELEASEKKCDDQMAQMKSEFANVERDLRLQVTQLQLKVYNLEHPNVT